MQKHRRVAVAETLVAFVALATISTACSECERMPDRRRIAPNCAFATTTSRRDGATTSTWIAALASASLVGATGIFPLLLVGFNYSPTKSPSLHRFLLSFAGGGLLGDVFLHILPETWSQLAKTGGDAMHAHLWIVFGFLVFLIVEIAASERETKEVRHDTGPQSRDVHEHSRNSSCDVASVPSSRVDVSGYLNLAANCVDNITHGLAISAAYLISFKVGALTTASILLHEVPHEIGDFAILLNAGFDHWSAAKAQIATASGGLIGAAAGLIAHDFADTTAWMLPFTAGGFIYVSTITVLPELLKETSLVETIKQLGGVVGGILVMGSVALLE